MTRWIATEAPRSAVIKLRGWKRRSFRCFPPAGNTNWCLRRRKENGIDFRNQHGPLQSKDNGPFRKRTFHVLFRSQESGVAVRKASESPKPTPNVESIEYGDRQEQTK